MQRRLKDLGWTAGLHLALVLALVAQSPAAPEVHNGTTAAQPSQTAALTELWRIGGPEDDENLLGVIGKVLADDEGNVYLLDVQLTEVLVYDGEGNYQRSLGQQGDGPGELRFVTDALFLPDGTVGLVQPFPGRIVKVDLEGLPAGEIRPGGDDPTKGGFFAVRGAAAVGSELVISGAKISRGENSRTAIDFVGRLATDGSEGVHYLERTTERQFGTNHFVEKDEYFPRESGWALAPDGTVIVAPQRNAYRLEVYGKDGTLLRVVTRDYKSVKRSDEEMAEAKDQMTPRRRRNRGAVNLEMESTTPDLVQFHVADDGRLWVLPSSGVRDQAPGVHSTWDVFDAAGSFETQIALACDANGRDDAVFFPGQDLVVVVRQFREAMKAFRGRGGENDTAEESEASPLEVICYRMAPIP